MGKLYLIILIFFILFHGINIAGEVTETGNKIEKNIDIVGRIGFLHSFVSDEPEVNDEVTIGVESYGEAFYKLCSSDGESVVKGGLLSKGLNIIGFPVDLITGKNKGVFFLFAKNGEHISGRQIVLLSDIIETFETDPGIDKDGSVSDRYRHEITVNGEDNRFNDYASRITRDSVTGDYPGLNQGIPILPILYLFIHKVLKTIKKKKKGPIPLFSETELYIKQKNEKGKYTLINLRILTSEI